MIGRAKFSYDLWGDTVNTASRMESHALPGTIQVTERAYERLRHRFELRPRGTVEVKGKGPVAAGLLGRGREVGEGGVGDAVGVEAERGGVVGVEAFDEVLGGERAPAGRAGLDAGGLVDLVAERVDLGASGGRDLADVEGRSPVQAEAQDDLLGLEVAARGDVG